MTLVTASRALPDAFPDAAHRPSGRDMPSLDGLRALSIGFVLLGHASHWQSRFVETMLARLAHFGVCVFFAISGYLITSLLWRDVEKRGHVHLGRFYLRRTLRIFPPYYAYLTVVALGAWFARWPFPPEMRWWPALSYLSNYFNTNWSLTGHSWSLSLEEQFYLTWPIALAACIRLRGRLAGARFGCLIASSALVALPMVRICVFGLSRNGVLTGAFIFDYVAAGSAIALFTNVGDWQLGRRELDRLLESRYTPLLCALALVLHLTFAGTTRWMFAVDTVLVTPIESVLLAVFVAWAVRNPSHSVGRVLNVRTLRVVGVGSYSLYLWQQLFMGPGVDFALPWSTPQKLIAAGVCAALSYWIVERPALNARTRIESRLSSRPPASAN